MKLFAVLLSLLGLSLLQEHPVAHACTCKKISSIVDKVQKAVAGLEDKLDSLASILEKGVTIPTEVPNQQPTTEKPSIPPNTSENPSPSCKDLHQKNPSAPSGYYWIGDASNSVRMYCSMEETCGSETGGWMRVANIDMRNTSQNCPDGLTLLTSPKRLCDLPFTTSRCVSNTLSVTGVSYTHVCGKIIAYQNNGPLAFYNHDLNIDGVYVNGVSLTHGRSPRKHIWTFAGALDESSTLGGWNRWKCPCIDSTSTVPSYVGNDYFCDTALLRDGSGGYGYGNLRVETSDPLWDGQGCTRSSCCSFNTPPWFVRDLPSPTTDDIEMRVCTPNIHGSTPIETVELYVQ